MRAVEKGISEERLPVFRSNAVAAVVLTCALGAPALAQRSAPPAPPLMPITLEGNVERGVVLAETCKGCHGIPGYYNASPAYHVPKLGGQNADYIEVALQGYRRGTRGHATMQAQASSLSDQDIADVAAYFAELRRRGRSAAARRRPPRRSKPAETKAATCMACHGPEGRRGRAAMAESRGPARDRTCSQALGQYKRRQPRRPAS